MFQQVSQQKPYYNHMTMTGTLKSHAVGSVVGPQGHSKTHGICPWFSSSLPTTRCLTRAVGETGGQSAGVCHYNFIPASTAIARTSRIVCSEAPRDLCDWVCSLSTEGFFSTCECSVHPVSFTDSLCLRQFACRVPTVDVNPPGNLFTRMIISHNRGAASVIFHLG